MANGKIIAVVGATGAQGGGLARAILDDPDSPFQVRALTRNARSDKAAELAGYGAQVVEADLDERESLESAFQGAHGAYCVTNFWEHFSPEKELAQAGNLAAAARDAGLAHVIWSTLEDTRERVPLEDGRMPTTFLLTSFDWDNFIHFGMGPRRGADGILAITLPMDGTRLPGIAAEDIGRCAYGIFRGGREYIGRTVGIAGEHLTGEEMAAALGAALGEEVRYNAVPPEVYRGLGFPGAEDLGNMFQYKRDFNEAFCGARSVELARTLNPSLQSFAQWLARNRDRIPLE
jgi:uncharacterized protein YbjT (DUF2867 family)